MEHALNELKLSRELLRAQVLGCYLVALCGGLVLVIDIIAPEYFIYPYIRWGGVASVLQFTPVFFVQAILAVFVCSRERASSDLKTVEQASLKVFCIDVLSAILAGVSHEFGFRYFFICFAITLIVFVNWCFRYGLNWLLTAYVIFLMVYFNEYKHDLSRVLRFALLLLTVFTVWSVGSSAVVYWAYDEVLIPVMQYTTVFQLDALFDDSHSRLFLYGAVLTNVIYALMNRSEGNLVAIHAWYVGVILLYATMIYGLLTAVVVHILCNVISVVVRLCFYSTTSR